MQASHQPRPAMLCLDIILATSGLSRLRGLLGRPPLQPGQGLWLSPCAAVHTFGMRKAIDVLFLDAEFKPLKRVFGLQPWRFSMCWRARSVLEMPAGGLVACGLANDD